MGSAAFDRGERERERGGWGVSRIMHVSSPYSPPVYLNEKLAIIFLSINRIEKALVHKKPPHTRKHA